MAFLTVTHSSKSDLGKILGQVLSTNPRLASQAVKKGQEFFDNLIYRSVKSTGYILKRDMTDAIRTNAFNLAPLRRHPQNGAIMATTIRQYFSGGKSQVPKNPFKYKTLKGRIMGRKYDDVAPGRKYGSIFSYKAKDEKLEVGMILKAKGGRANSFWADAFEEWQEAGTVDIPYTGNRGQMRGIFGLMGAAQMPISENTTLRRPARPFIDIAQDRLKPLDIFRQKLIEKLNK